MLDNLGASVLVLGTVFVATNVDGLSVLALLFAIDPPRDRARALASACVAFAVIVLASAFAAVLVHTLAPAWARWLGLLLVAAGVIRLALWMRNGRLSASTALTNTTVFTAVLLTGGDNFVVYTAIFANLGPLRAGVAGVAYVAAFGLLTLALLQLLARNRFARPPAVFWEPLTALVLIAAGIVTAMRTPLA
jgi:cadmium resistance protein CadD (predicted permease)